MTEEEILALMNGNTLLNKVRRILSSGIAKIEQKSLQGANIFEIREMEFVLSLEIAKLLSVDLLDLAKT